MTVHKHDPEIRKINREFRDSLAMEIWEWLDAKKVTQTDLD